MELWKLGCRWGSGTPLFYDFIKEKNILIGWVDKDYLLGSFILVTDGHTVLDIAEVKSIRKSVLDFPAYQSKFQRLEIPYNDSIFIYEARFLNILEEDRFTYPLQQGIVRVQGQEYINKFQMLKMKYIKNEKMKNYIELLKYKKQIILQGPPGTGKTRLAKEIAEQMIELKVLKAKPSTISSSDILRYLKVGVEIASVKERATYTVTEITSNNVRLTLAGGKTYSPNFSDIIEWYENNKWDKKGEQSNQLDPYNAAIAKFIYENIHIKTNIQEFDQFKLIQFHPSYTYEDFVRGIVSKPNEDGDGIVYEAENKVLADFAKKALDNYIESNKTSVVFHEDSSIFDAFIENIKDELAQNEHHKYDITEAVYLFSADETRFKYKGDNWVAHSKGLNMKFSELKKIIDSGATERQDIKKMTDVEELTRQHATYFIKIVEKYYTFKETFKDSIPLQHNTELKNYVLIIDEINRANLSSVLGELIYALEYRGEAVESMYKIGEDNKLILPPNLYIIGTMNTADRSVGHIDYAIRRRFAFVDVLPQDLSNDENIIFDSQLFSQVAELFNTNLSPEFDQKDVQLGHSYFIDKSKDGGSMAIRLEYEIKPILLEYVKDGVLIGDDIKELIEKLEPSI